MTAVSVMPFWDSTDIDIVSPSNHSMTPSKFDLLVSKKCKILEQEISKQTSVVKIKKWIRLLEYQNIQKEKTPKQIYKNE